jgi:hypothetical protein
MYICASEVHHPEHPLVLEAGSLLIMILGRTGDYYDAERFARISYESFTRASSDPESYDVAKPLFI